MTIKLTNPDALDDVIAQLDKQCPLSEYNDTFIRHCVPYIKERIVKGDVIFLESEYCTHNSKIYQMLSYWSLDDVPTDKEYLNSYDAKS